MTLIGARRTRRPWGLAVFLGLAIVGMVGCSSSTSESRVADGDALAICFGLNAEGPGVLCSVGVGSGTDLIYDVEVDEGEGIDISPDRQNAATVLDGTLHIVDLHTLESTDTGVAGTAPSWTPNGDVVLEADDGIVRVEVAESFSARVIVPTGIDLSELGPAEVVHPDTNGSDERLAFIAEGQNGEFGRYSSDLDGGDIALLLGPFSDTLASPQWSPDGQAIAYVREVHLEVLYLEDGRTLRPIPEPQPFVATPAWSPNGEEILYLDAVGPMLTIVDPADSAGPTDTRAYPVPWNSALDVVATSPSWG